MTELPDDYNKLQELASEHGYDNVIGASKDNLTKYLKNQDIMEEELSSQDEPEEDTDPVDEDSGDTSSKPEDIEEHTIDLEKHLGEDSEESTDNSAEDHDTVSTEQESAEELEEALDQVDKKGLDEAVNNLWGRIWTIDKDPEDEEAENIRKNLSAMAEDVGLGENAKWWADENLFTDEEQTPQQALMTSLLMASVVSLGMREDLLKKGYQKAKNTTSEQQSDDGGDEE